MTRARPILVGGAAAVVLAGASQLFPRFGETEQIALPSSEEFSAGKSAFEAIMRDPTNRLGALEQIGFTSSPIDGSQHTVLLKETAGHCSGRGVYWLRKGASNKLAITAPHRGSDRYTGQLAAALFEETAAHAAAWNSAPRRHTPQCEHGIDLARERDHLFSAFTLAFAEAQPTGLVVQLHGFDRERRKTLEAQEAGMIVSNGTENPSAKLLDLTDCLSLAFAPTPVLLYPGDTDELGALTNAQGQLLNHAGFDGFAHIEIAAHLRAKLISDHDLRAKFAACLMENAA